MRIDDSIGNSIRIARENHELHRLVTATHPIVDGGRADEEHDKAIDDTEPIVEDEVARGYDNHVASHDDGAQRHVSVLVHDSSNDVSTPCGPIVGKTESNTCATKDGSQDTSHEGLLADELGKDVGFRIIRVRYFDDAL